MKTFELLYLVFIEWLAIYLRFRNKSTFERVIDS